MTNNFVALFLSSIRIRGCFIISWCGMVDRLKRNTNQKGDDVLVDCGYFAKLDHLTSPLQTAIAGGKVVVAGLIGLFFGYVMDTWLGTEPWYLFLLVLLVYMVVLLMCLGL